MTSRVPSVAERDSLSETLGRLLRTASSAALVAALFAGCTAAERPDPQPTSSEQPAPASRSAGPVVDRTASIETGSDYIGSLTYADDTAVFGFAANPALNYADSVGIWETSQNEVRTVATTEYPVGTVSGIAFDGESIVFVDISRQASTESGDLLAWKVRRIGVDGSGAQVLATSPPQGSVTAPIVKAGDGRFAWTTWEDPEDPLAGRRVYEWQVGDDKPRIVARGIWLNDSAIPVDGGFVYTETDRSNRWPSGMYRTDLYLRRTDGSTKPVNISTSGLVLEYSVTQDGVVWTETHPKTRTTGTRSDPFKVYARPLEGGDQVTQLATGYMSGNLAGGDGWVAWWSSLLDLTVSPDSVASPVELDTSRTFVPARPAADGDSLVIGESSIDGVRLTIVSVEL
jgi:hypothetical protein